MRRRERRHLGGGLWAALVLTLVAGPAAASGAAPSYRFRPPWTAAGFAGHTAYEDAIVRHLNALRRSRGLRELVPDERLRAAARQHTVEMIQKRYYAHPSPVAAWKTPAQRACHAGYLDSFVSENIGMISGYPDVALALHESWKKSPGHYRNMVDPNVTRIGVGVTSTQKNGMTIWLGTQNFAADPLDLRGIAVAMETRDVVRVTARLQTNGGLTVKAWRGRQFAGEVPAVGSTHTFTADLPWPVATSERISFAVQTGSETPLVCAHVDVGPGGTLRPSRVTYHPLCRRITDLSVQGPRTRVRRRVLSGEALAQSTEALGARFFLNRVWGPLLPLARGRWTRFSVPLPDADEVRFSLVLTRIQKDYLTLDFRRANPFVCP